MNCPICQSAMSGVRSMLGSNYVCYICRVCEAVQLHYKYNSNELIGWSRIFKNYFLHSNNLENVTSLGTELKLNYYTSINIDNFLNETKIVFNKLKNLLILK